MSIIIIVGEQDYHRYGQGHKSSKIKKAEKILLNGSDIELISENQFLEMIDFNWSKIDLVQYTLTSSN